MTSPLKLLEKIGQGPNSTVYRAEDLRDQAEVAVKICEAAAEDCLANQRFQREIQLAQSLTNPHAIKVFDSGITAEGRPYYSMELIGGWTLANIITQSGRLADGRTQSILLQACEFLSEVHQQGLVHRDIKPSNMMLFWNHTHELLKVLDLGLMLSVADRPIAGMLSGTPHYMSPESIQNPSHLDCRSDIYSLGCVAYQLVAGTTPFQGNNPLQICAKQVRETAPALTELAEVDVCEELSNLIAGCMAKDPQQRPQSVAELAQALHQIRPRWTWLPSDAWRWWTEKQPHKSC